MIVILLIINILTFYRENRILHKVECKYTYFLWDTGFLRKIFTIFLFVFFTK